MGATDDYDFRTFPAAVTDDGASEPATAAWIAAERRGFHDTRASAESLDLTASNMVGDGRQLTGAYPKHADTGIPLATDTAPTATAPAAPAATATAPVATATAPTAPAATSPAPAPTPPVATFASYPSTLNVGAPDLLPVHLISNVTVRPTHRRRGLLRHLMTENLRRASGAGFAVAALTVSEATIYRRFGFGVATTVGHSTVRTDERFRMLTPPPGRCEFVEPEEIRRLGPAVFARFHASHAGSVDRHTATWARFTGARSEKSDPDPTVYAAMHFDDAGDPDGYVTYRTRGAGGAENGTDADFVEIVDLVAADDGAYLGLWDFLASIDLTGAVEWAVAPADDPLRWAIADWRAVKQTFVEDWLWIRVLDVTAAFEARGYAPGVAGSLTVAVTDALGYASGTYTLRVQDARATVTRDDAARPDLTLAAPELGSLYLGGVDPLTLLAAARLAEHTPGAARRLGTLLAPAAPVYGTTHF